ARRRAAAGPGPRRRGSCVERDAVPGDGVPGLVQRAGAAPAPEQDDVHAAGVVEAVPVAQQREDDVARARRLAAGVRVDLALAAEDDQELVAVLVQVAVVAG